MGLPMLSILFLLSLRSYSIYAYLAILFPFLSLFNIVPGFPETIFETDLDTEIRIHECPVRGRKWVAIGSMGNPLWMEHRYRWL